MAQKKITDLTLRTNFDDTCNLPADDTSQTWRVTGAQMLTYFKAQISPLTTRGDIITAGASAVLQRLALGATGKVLTSNGTDVVYDYPNSSISSKTAAYTLVDSDNTIKASASGAGFTLTLPTAAAGNSGKRYIIKKTDSTFNAVTVSGGAFTTTLNTQNEVVEVQSDGAVWEVIRRYVPSVVAGLTVTIGGLGTVTGTNAFFWRVGDRLVCRGYTISPNPIGVTSALYVQLPSGIAIDTAKFASGVTQQIGRSYQMQSLSDCFATFSSGPFPLFYDGTTTNQIFVSKDATSPNTFVKRNGVNIIAPGSAYHFDFEIPVSGWNG